MREGDERSAVIHWQSSVYAYVDIIHTYCAFLHASQGNYSFFHLASSGEQAIQERHYVLRLLSVDPVVLGMIRFKYKSVSRMQNMAQGRT
jgi:hypothetical protein